MDIKEGKIYQDKGEELYQKEQKNESVIFGTRILKKVGKSKDVFETNCNNSSRPKQYNVACIFRPSFRP